MEIHEIVKEIDAEIARLTEVRGILSGEHRPLKKAAKKRNLTPEGRKRIAEAMRRRWAARKKAAK